MSQTAPGEAGGGGNPSHSSNKFFHQPIQAPVRANFLPQGQGGAQYGSFIPHFPVKPTNPHMGNRYPRPHGPMQFNMHSSHINSQQQQQQQHMHYLNSMKNRSDNSAAATMTHPYQQNHCGNLQYFSGGNYVTTVTVNPGEQQQTHQNQLVHPLQQQQQYMHTPQNYFVNSSSMMNNMQNMVIHQNATKNTSLCDNGGSHKRQPVSVSNAGNTVEPENKCLMQNKDSNKINENSFLDGNSPTNQREKCNKISSKNLGESSNDNVGSIISSLDSNNQKSNGNNLVNNRPRTSSRCDSVRSETGESSCSSLSTDSMPDQNHLSSHSQQHSLSMKNNHHHHYHFASNPPLHNQMHSMNDFNSMNHNGNMNYQNYMACQARMNQVTGKPTMYNNPGMVQAFQQINTVQHVQVQHSGQVQIMQQQYQSLQSPGIAGQTMGMISNPHQGQSTAAIIPTGNGSMQGQNNSGMIPDHNQNLNVLQNCVSHSGAVPVPPPTAQNFSASTPHGQFPLSLIHPQTKAPSSFQQQNLRMGITGTLPGGTNPLNKGLPPVVIVPFGWKRVNNNGQIIYISPSGSELRNPMEVCDYLTQQNTCKCGLQCPLRVENIFCFDPKVPHRLTTPEELSSGEATKVCNHRRKLALAFSHHLQKQAKKEDGRKKRKRKVAESVNSPSHSSAPTPTIGGQHPVVANQASFNPQVQTQQQDSQQMQQQQQYVYQSNPNQNWNGMYGVPRMMIPNTGMVGGGCQGNHETYCAMNNTQQTPCNTAQPFANPPQNCCENHHCFAGHQNTQALHQGMRPTFGNKPQFCRLPNDMMFKGMIPSQGGCIPQQALHHPMVSGNRASHQPMPTNSICRVPLNTSGMQQQMFASGNTPQGITAGAENIGGVSQQEPASGGKTSSHSEEMEKRRRTASTRSRKKAKLAADRNSPCPPNVDVRNLESENAISPHTGPGPPFLSAPQSSSSEPEMGGNSRGSPSSSLQGSLPVSGPSFMEDPNGYLAQQTVLLNNTMSGGGVGQFSPQGARLSPRPPAPPISSHSNSPLPVKNSHQAFTSRVSVPNSKPSPVVVPLPSNVPLPARVSKVSAITSPGFAATSTTTLAGTSSCATLCTSVHSKSSSNAGTSLPDNSNSSTKFKSEAETFAPRDNKGTLVATAESSFVNHTVTVTYTHSSVTTTTCGSESNSPHSSQDVDNSEGNFGHSDAAPVDENQLSSLESINKSAKNVSSMSAASSSSKNFVIRPKITEQQQQKKKIDLVIPDTISTNTCSSNTNSASSLSSEAANKPLTPGPAESSMATQSPLEMVQNIVSSIPLPASSDELTPVTGKVQSHQPSQLIQEQLPAIHPALPHQQLISPHVYNMTGSNNMTSVMYSPSGGNPGMLRGTGSLVVHGATPSGSIPPGVLVSNSGNVVVVTSPFNSKVSGVTTPVVCSNVSGIAPMVGVQAVPQVQVQPSLASVQSHQLQPIQPVQPVVQFVNTFATMQAPVIIQNGSNIIQPPSGVLSSHGGVIGPASIIPSSTPAFVTSQPLLAVDSSSHSSQMQMTQVVTSTSSEASDDSGSSSSRLTPVATPASTPTTPHSTPGSETPPSGGSSSGSGRKRKRRRNSSTPQGGQPQQQQQQQKQHPSQPTQSIVPAIIMGKQLPQQMVMNGTQISQVAPYGSVAGAQVATVTAMGANGSQGAPVSQMLTPAGQPSSSINVVQMVGGPVAGPLPVHLQQPHTILVPSAATQGVIINQLPDGTFVSTDPNSGVTYPVQLQLSGSHIVGVSPVANSTSNPGVVASIATPSSLPQGAMVAVRPPPTPTSSVINPNTKLINISPSVASSSQGETLMNNVYGVTPSAAAVGPHSNIVTTPVGPGYSSNNAPQYGQQLQQQPTVPPTDEASLQQSLIVGGNGNATLLQQKTTTIVAQHTTVVVTQGGLMGTHSSVSTQTSGLLGESDVTSSDCVANPTTTRDFPASPSHQSAEVTTTRQDEDAASTPESLLVSPQGHSSPEAAAAAAAAAASSKKAPQLLSKGTAEGQEPHSATTSGVWW